MVGWVTLGKVSGMDERKVLALIFDKMDNFRGGIANCDTLIDNMNLSYGEE